MRYYVIEGSVATGYADWESAAADYLASGGTSIVAEPVRVRLLPASDVATDDTRTDRARELLRQGIPPMRVMEQTGLSRQAVYIVRARMLKAGEVLPDQRSKRLPPGI